MKKLKKTPRLAKEIIITVISFTALCLLWAFVIKDHAMLSNQGLSTIGIAISTSIGVLTAIIVSFALIVWQISRRDRSDSFLRWRNTLHQLDEFYDIHMEKLEDVYNEVTALTFAAHEVASVSPMSLKRCKELVNAVFNKVTKDSEQLQGVQNPSKEQIEKARARKYMSDYLVMLAHANFEHNIAHNLYKGLLDLRGLLYRLLSLLILCIVIVAIASTTTSVEVSDTFNIPLALVLIAWAIYLLVHLGIEIKRFTRLEDKFRRFEADIENKSQ